MTQEALRLALEALLHAHHEDEAHPRTLEAITAIKEALAQEQAPVAWGVDWGRAGDIPCVSIIKRLPNGGIEVVAVEYAPYSKTATPQRTWVGLADYEIQECYSESYKIVQGRQLEIAFYKTIEAKLKLKNGYAEEKNT